MNNIKKTCFGLLLAGLTFGFSAFKNVQRSKILTYYKVTMTYPAANNPNGYVYYSGNRCETIGNLCSAAWDIGSNPLPTTDGALLPLTGVTFQTGSVVAGHFE